MGLDGGIEQQRIDGNGDPSGIVGDASNEVGQERIVGGSEQQIPERIGAGFGFGFLRDVFHLAEQREGTGQVVASQQIQRDLVVRQQNIAVRLLQSVIGISSESVEVAGYDVVANRPVTAVGLDVPATAYYAEASSAERGVVAGKRVEAVGIAVTVQVDGRFRIEARECERVTGNDVTVAGGDGEV